jgi:5-hydroxyisourate hydrolase-like protein (transthyretin family)
VRFSVLACAFAALPVVALLVHEPAPAEAAAILSPEAAAVHKTKDNKFWVAVSLTNPGDKKLQGTLKVELLDKDGQSLATEEKPVEQTEKTANYRFELPAGKGDTEGLKLRYSFGKEQVEAELSKILLAKAHETALATSPELYAGSSAALRCDVHAVKSVAETVPLPGSTVAVTLRAKDGQTYDLYRGKTGDDGLARGEMKVPKLPAGDYKLVVATTSTLGDEKLERDVKVKGEPKVLLVTDKPLYQPGQVIHVRALCLRPFDLTPVEASALTFEIEDPKGNKVFKRSLTTSEFGVASVDFQLADEINMGSYQVRAQIGDQQAHKTVEVKKYVLPKFKVDVTADKKFYLPKETVTVDLRSDYFFGKPVANGKVKVTASTFDVQFKDFQTVDTKTDANGHAKVEIKLPDYFVGQPLQKGDALVKLEVKLTDTADHTETVTRTYPVADQPIKVSLIPESGRLMPGVENRIFAAAIYPDGSPAAGCEIKFWKGREAKDKPYATARTGEAGLAELKLTPKREDFREGGWGPRNVEAVGAVAPQAWGPKLLFDVAVEARDAKGNTAKAAAELNSEPLGENVLLRLNKAIYKAGDTMTVDVLTSAGLPTTYLDVVKSGQTLLTRWLDVKDGKANYKLDLPPGVFGTLEVHAYQQLASGEIIRDSRVVYVHSREDLKIDAKADKDVYLPGDAGKIVFTVTDKDGKPTAAALGVIIVDEAVYALQELQPGLEKVYFTLQEELLKPQAQNAAPAPGPMPMPGPRRPGPGPVAPPVVAAFKPAEGLDQLVREGDLPGEKQQIAEVLLTTVHPKPPVRLNIDPVQERKQKFQAVVQQIAWALFNYAAQDNEVLVYDSKARHWTYKDGLLDELVKKNLLPKDVLTDPFGKKLSLADLAKIEKNFTPDRFGKAVTLHRMQQLIWGVVNLSNANQAKWLKDGKWDFPESVLRDAARNQRLDEKLLKDAWGKPVKLVRRDKKIEHALGFSQFDYHEIVSAGPDGKFDTEDDVKSSAKDGWQLAQGQWLLEQEGLLGAMDGGLALRRNLGDQAAFGMPFGGGGPPGAPPAPMAAAPGGVGGGGAMRPMVMDRPAEAKGAVAHGGGGESAPPTRLREYFPETLLWRPALITDDKGRAELPLNFADSITTWRLSASASSKGGALGGMTSPLRVFQDFFVDLDLPVALTQNDEVAFPVAVYNYLKTPQTVILELQPEPWFELMDGGNVRSLDLKPNEVTGVKFRIKARKIGQQPLTVQARGSKMSDAIKRSVEVVPDGKKVEQVVSDKLTGKVKQTLTIPEDAIPDASKLIVKLYPGVFSQVLEGTEGMLRMPGG